MIRRLVAPSSARRSLDSDSGSLGIAKGALKKLAVRPPGIREKGGFTNKLWNEIFARLTVFATHAAAAAVSLLPPLHLPIPTTKKRAANVDASPRRPVPPFSKDSSQRPTKRRK